MALDDCETSAKLDMYELEDSGWMMTRTPFPGCHSVWHTAEAPVLSLPPPSGKLWREAYKCSISNLSTQTWACQAGLPTGKLCGGIIINTLGLCSGSYSKLSYKPGIWNNRYLFFSRFENLKLMCFWKTAESLEAGGATISSLFLGAVASDFL